MMHIAIPTKAMHALCVSVSMSCHGNLTLDALMSFLYSGAVPDDCRSQLDYALEKLPLSLWCKALRSFEGDEQTQMRHMIFRYAEATVTCDRRDGGWERGNRYFVAASGAAGIDRVVIVDRSKSVGAPGVSGNCLRCRGRIRPCRNRADRHRSGVHLFQGTSFVHGDMVGLVTSDLVLRIVHAGVMDVPLEVGICRVHLDDLAAHMAGLRIPGHMISNLESRCRDEYPPFGAAYGAVTSECVGVAGHSTAHFYGDPVQFTVDDVMKQFKLKKLSKSMMHKRRLRQVQCRLEPGNLRGNPGKTRKKRPDNNRADNISSQGDKVGLLIIDNQAGQISSGHPTSSLAAARLRSLRIYFERRADVH